MEIREALTFDDVLLVPAASSVLPSTDPNDGRRAQALAINPFRVSETGGGTRWKKAS